MGIRTVPDLLAGLLAEDATRPVLTFYDDRDGSRVELSVASFDNAVAKTANLLQEEIGTEPGDAVCLLLPAHWQAAVAAFAAAACGLRLVTDPASARVVFAGPDTLQQAVETIDAEVVAMALRPLGGPFTAPLPAGVVDHGVDAPGQPDVYVAAVPVTPDLPYLGDEPQGTVLTRAADVAAALPEGCRLLTDRSPATPDGLVDGVLAPLLRGGSVVLVAHLDPARLAARQADERVDRTLLG